MEDLCKGRGGEFFAARPSIRLSSRLVKNRCHTPIGGIFIQKRKLILHGFSN
ncbi:hypothetical protein GC56T2_3050 [Geobacillus sp. C56-T2]|nr:hypothetical protein GC56T2_3050 [Geobacillus sp. C56-T2]